MNSIFFVFIKYLMNTKTSKYQNQHTDWAASKYRIYNTGAETAGWGRGEGAGRLVEVSDVLSSNDSLLLQSGDHWPVDIAT